jgi:hypothetical protein
MKIIVIVEKYYIPIWLDFLKKKPIFLIIPWVIHLDERGY